MRKICCAHDFWFLTQKSLLLLLLCVPNNAQKVMAQEQQPPPDATHSECGVDASPLKVWQPANRISSEEATSLIYYLGGISLLGLGAFLILQFIFREQPVRPSKPFVKIPKNDAPVDVDE